MSLYDKIFPPRITTLPNGKTVSKPRSRGPFIILAVLALSYLSVKITGFDPSVIVRRSKEFLRLR